MNDGRRFYCPHCWVVFRDTVAPASAEVSRCPRCDTSCHAVELTDDYPIGERVSPSDLIDLLYYD